MSNRIGKRGENIFSMIITRKSAAGNYLFDPTFLGEKFPTVDFYVSLYDHPLKAFFFASVKTTTLGYTKGDKLNYTIDKDEVAELQKFSLPVFLFGIDEPNESGYFIPLTGLDSALNINGIPTIYPVDPPNLERLYREVSDYWEYHDKNTKFVSSFK